MTSADSHRTLQPPQREPQFNDSALDVEDSLPASAPSPQTGGRRPSQLINYGRRPSGHVSFSSMLRHRPSFASRWKNGAVDEEAGVSSPRPERPPIPSALQPPPEVYSTPLPTLSMIVLSITMLGEFLSANVSAPFLLFMVEGFNQFENEADVGYWTGLLVSTFFLTQFLTSLLWATVAAKHGQRLVIAVSLLGSSVTCVMFGTSTSIQQAMVIRLMQGVFAGAIGVARGAVTGITDTSNEGRAYAILGFCWGLGGVAGAIVGGTFESPAKKWPRVFSQISLFVQYPYLLPTLVASVVTLAGSVLSLFLGPDCGPRGGSIRLPPEKVDDHSAIQEESPPISPIEEEAPKGLMGSIGRKVSRRFSGIFASRVPDAGLSSSTSVPVHLSRTTARDRAFSHTSRAGGSAYGYGGAYRARLASSNSLARLSARRGSVAASSYRQRRESNVMGANGEESISASYVTGTNFAQRLLMANENAVTNIADLWVAAAINVDNEDPFESEDEDRLDGEDGDGDLDETENFASGQLSRRNQFLRKPSFGPSVRSAVAGSPLRPSTLIPRDSSIHRSQSVTSPSDVPSPGPARRFSTTIPGIFSHTGVRTPPAVVEAQKLLALADEVEDAGQETLFPIREGSRPIEPDTEPDISLKEPSLMSQLPLMIIFQYGILALHNTTHDQVFYLYLVSKYPSGGLNLNAGHFSQLIALMCLAQIVYQFYFYPNIGPPRGRFSHLAMFRIGSLIYIPAYLSVVLYRVFANDKDEGSLILMCALAVSTATRFCGITFTYTAISVLLNYMSPPHVVGYANGIAQSIVSLARFCGPVLGGLLWSTSVQDNPSGYPLGFVICSVVCALAVAHSLFIR
ncbi:hypothetical protein BDY19DRAFT_247311 [Irpex rosettiformis]|uniref:Uncharacterized protein n=1 Tax=Irpex rosettiformis TaxID=378272 RepID=A0ACB8U018_9APHY|nr:hypothetical protein BDY19DRAFT_247311 [Irpex rosettiformis]